MSPNRIRSIVPNLLTLANLFCGFASIVYSSKNEFEFACMYIIVGTIFDMFDGIAARLVNATSDFGVELDSLCDAVTFGAAPSFLFYSLYFTGDGNLGILIASLPLLGGILRLARFNVELETFEDKEYFKGLPIPAMALLLISFYLFDFPEELTKVFGNIIPRKALVNAVLFVFPLLMVSNIRFENAPRPSLKYIKKKPFFSLYVLVSLIVGIYTQGNLVFPLFLIFIIFGTIRHFVLWIRSKSDPEEEVDSSFESINANKAPFDI